MPTQNTKNHQQLMAMASDNSQPNNYWWRTVALAAIERVEYLESLSAPPVDPIFSRVTPTGFAIPEHFPRTVDVCAAVVEATSHEPDDQPMDLHLQVHANGSWAVHSGDRSLIGGDHRSGTWGSTPTRGQLSPDQAAAVATHLIQSACSAYYISRGR